MMMISEGVMLVAMAMRSLLRLQPTTNHRCCGCSQPPTTAAVCGGLGQLGGV